MPRSSKLDIVVYGATGFTGRLVAEHLARRYGVGDEVSWAMAGRSAYKLAAVRDEIGAPADTPLIEANAEDVASLRNMVGQAKVVITTVGPYQLYGSALVAACAAAGTDYLDLCGEPQWIRRMIDTYHQTAQRTGARILFSCGFDSIPSELGVLFLQETAKAALGAPVKQVKYRVRYLHMPGGFSGGTVASLNAKLAAAAEDPSIAALLSDPFALTPGFHGPDQPQDNEPAFDRDLAAWTAPFFMAFINTRNVHRSNFLQDHAYGTDSIYDEMFLTGPGEEGEAVARVIASTSLPLQGEDAPKPGEGPSKAERDAGSFDLLFVGLGKGRRQVHVSVTGDSDPGYGSTSKVVAETAICLLRHGENIAGGIWTPGAALGRQLIDHLETNSGLVFKIETV